MSIRKKFNEIFGLKDNIEAERKRFVERVNQVIFHEIDTSQSETFVYDILFEKLCYQLGVNVHDIPDRVSYTSYGEEIYRPASIRTLTNDDFNKTLLVLCILYAYLQETNFFSPNATREWLSIQVELVLSQCSCDIGIRWKEGFFYPTGAEELDESLIDESLTWLSDYPNERKDYRRALECFLGDESLSDVVNNCYSAVEGVARNILRNQKTLDNNKNKLLSKMNLSDGWNSILANYIRYAHDYRHADEQRHDITKQEAEAYLYMTGLIIRLIIESK